MKLLYLWKRQWDHINLNVGLQISPEYDIAFNYDTRELRLNYNSKYIPYFYGKNISEVSAIVGVNGSGKSTIAINLADYCGSIKAIVDHNSVPPEEFIQVYSSDKKAIIYYYLSGRQLQVLGDAQVEKCCDVTRLNDTPNGFFNEDSNHNCTAAYISNVFMPDDLTSRGKTSNLRLGDLNKRMSYTPGVCLKTARLRYEDKYGAAENGKQGRVYNIITLYETRMSNDPLRDYDDYQGELFIRCYKSVPDAIKSTLPIFKQFQIGIFQFGAYLNMKDNSIYDEFDKQVVFIRSRIVPKNIVDLPMFLQCYLNIICEADLFFGDVKNGEGNLVRTDVGMTIDEYLSKENHDIDIAILESIEGCIRNWKESEHNFSNAGWLRQLQSCIEVLQKYQTDEFIVAKQGGVVSHNFLDSEYILNFFLDETRKEYSFFRRYILFAPLPTSSGELALANIFGYIQDALTKKNSDNMILIVDEIDAMLHPVWQQQILKWLIRYIEERYPDKQFQIILTTHSPIILSDLTGDRVIRLNRKDSETQVAPDNRPILGANIERLFYDDFFMDTGSIGEIAKEKISLVLKYLNNEVVEPKLNIEFIIEYIIESIGEPIVRNKLKIKYGEKHAENKDAFALKALVEKIGTKEAKEIISSMDER